MASFQPAAVSPGLERGFPVRPPSVRGGRWPRPDARGPRLSRAHPRSLGVVTMMLPVRATTHQYARPVKAEGFDCTAYAQVART